MDKIIEQMKQLGMTEYEVKAYITLLKDYPINGYHLSKQSGIPRSRIYEVLNGLVKKQVVFEHMGEKSSTYSPLEPKLLVKKLKENFEQIIDEVESFTQACFEETKEMHEPVMLKGKQEIMNMVRLLVSEAKNRIALSVWDEELREFLRELNKAKSRGVKLRGIYFGHDNPLESLVSHRRIERYVAEKRERYLIVIVDEEHVISGIISRDENTTVTWSKDPGIIDISDDYIAHDVMLNTIKSTLRNDLAEQLENELDAIRKAYYGFSDEEFHAFPPPPKH